MPYATKSAEGSSSAESMPDYAGLAEQFAAHRRQLDEPLHAQADFTRLNSAVGLVGIIVGALLLALGHDPSGLGHWMRGCLAIAPSVAYRWGWMGAAVGVIAILLNGSVQFRAVRREWTLKNMQIRRRVESRRRQTSRCFDCRPAAQGAHVRAAPSALAYPYRGGPLVTPPPIVRRGDKS